VLIDHHLFGVPLSDWGCSICSGLLLIGLVVPGLDAGLVGFGVLGGLTIFASLGAAYPTRPFLAWCLSLPALGPRPS
jgi:hypothetical protein